MLKKVFGQIEMKWWKVIVFAIIMGIYTGVIAIFVPEDNWVRDIAATPERWVLPTILIIVNCKKPLEAGLKTIVFFLISQPLVYLVQVPFAEMGWQLFHYYPYWFKITLLTFPGAIIGWFIKKDNILSGVILSVVLALLAYSGMGYLLDTIRHFPKDLGGVIYCFGVIVLLIFAVFTDKKPKIVAGLIVIAVIVTLFILKRSDNSSVMTVNGYLDVEKYQITLDWTAEVADDSVAGATVQKNYAGETDVSISFKKEGETELYLKGPDGKQCTFEISYDKERQPDVKIEEKK